MPRRADGEDKVLYLGFAAGEGSAERRGTGKEARPGNEATAAKVAVVYSALSVFSL